MALSRREQDVLTRLENDFTRKEKGIAAALDAGIVRRLRYSPALRTWLGLLGLLMLGLTAIPLGLALLHLGSQGLAVLTSLIVASWIALASYRLTRDRPGT
jgi:hypothetical protein